MERVPLRKQLDTLVELQREGRARHVGVSNFLPGQIDHVVEHLPDDAPLFAHQAEYHPFLDQSPLLERARTHDHTFTAYSPLARGRVVGHETLEEIGARHGTSAAQVALRWLLQQETVSAIPKAASAERRAANAYVFDFELNAEEMEAISSLRGNKRILDPDFAPDWSD